MSITEIITWPFAWLLRTFYEVFGNYGIAIILFAIVIKLVFLPFQMKSKRSTMRSARLAPLQKELEKKYGDDKQKYQEAVAKLYKEEGVNPMSGCLWSILPLIVMMMLYTVIRQPLTSIMGIGEEALTAVKNTMEGMGATLPTGAYAEVQIANFVHQNFSAFAGISDKLINMDFTFLGLNLGAIPSWNIFKFGWSDPAIWGQELGLFFIPVISGLLSFLSSKISMASNPSAAPQQGSMKTMMLLMPLMSVYFCFIMPAAAGIYWIMNSLLIMVQDLILNKYYGKILDAEDAERRERMKKAEAELERKRQETERLRELGATEKNKNTSKKKIQAAEKAKNEERLAQEKAERRAALGITDETPESQVGNRRYARGRAYAADRFEDTKSAVDSPVSDVQTESSDDDSGADDE